METANKLFYSGTKFFTENEEDYRITVRISLDDDCKNNICDWSITADVDWKNKHGKYEDYLGGCCHNEVAKHFPELAKFISLHLCNHYGAPMYPVENGTYHIKNSDKSVAIEYLRISDKEYSKLSEAVDDEMYFKYLLFDLGIVDRWKRESDELLVALENLCGKKWVNPYKPEKERFTLTLTDEERLLIEERIKAGYYSAENIEKRREEARRMWQVVSLLHQGGQFRHGLVEDVDGNRWRINRYENDMLTAGCHRIAYSEMESIAKQLGWA